MFLEKGKSEVKENLAHVLYYFYFTRIIIVLLFSNIYYLISKLIIFGSD